MYVKAVNGRARSFFFLINFPTSAFVIEGKSQNREELRRLKKIHNSPWDVRKTLDKFAKIAWYGDTLLKYGLSGKWRKVG
jgi:hypothetical protein